MDVGVGYEMKRGNLLGLFCNLILFLTMLGMTSDGYAQKPLPTARTTILCYMNGDNDLASEVFHAIDMMETVGSSEQVNVVALADGHPDWLGSYNKEWQHTRLIRISHDDRIGEIRSPVLEEWQEADLGGQETLQRFVQTAIHRFPAEHYIFLMFAHGRGIINTKQFASPAQGKRLSISRDTTSGSRMSMPQFQNALATALAGRHFELTILSSCLSNMVEIGYELSDVTHFLIASQDEIRLLNEPPGAFQIRGIKFEKIIQRLQDAPGTSMENLCSAVIEDYMADYLPENEPASDVQTGSRCRFPATMAAIDCRQTVPLAAQLDRLSALIIDRLEKPAFLKEWQSVLKETRKFPSFLNLEYYDLGNLAEKAILITEDAQIRQQCRMILSQLNSQLIVHEKHTPGQPASGVSIYLSNPLVPGNIFDVHQSLYGQCRFSRDTRWDDMINDYQRRIGHSRKEANSEPR